MSTHEVKKLKIRTIRETTVEGPMAQIQAIKRSHTFKKLIVLPHLRARRLRLIKNNMLHSQIKATEEVIKSRVRILEETKEMLILPNNHTRAVNN